MRLLRIFKDRCVSTEHDLRCASAGVLASTASIARPFVLALRPANRCSWLPAGCGFRLWWAIRFSNWQLARSFHDAAFTTTRTLVHNQMAKWQLHLDRHGWWYNDEAIAYRPSPRTPTVALLAMRTSSANSTPARHRWLGTNSGTASNAIVVVADNVQYSTITNLRRPRSHDALCRWLARSSTPGGGGLWMTRSSLTPG